MHLKNRTKLTILTGLGRMNFREPYGFRFYITTHND